jgi:hypothetical protein
MSDFLGNLALKSLGLASLVQPRPLSPFEALPTGGALAKRAAAEHSAESAPVESETMVWPRPSASAMPVEPAGIDSAQRPPAPRAQAVAGLRLEPVAEETQSRLPPTPPPLRRAAAQLVANPALASGPEAERAPEAPVRSARPPQRIWPARLEVEPAPLPETPPPARAHSPENRGTPVAPVSAASVKDDAAKEIESRPVTAAPRPVLTPIIERIKAGPAHDQAQTATAAPNAPAPTITVTIGRVEVRAAPPAASARRVVEKPGPVLSLEDYLRLRSGGKP